MEKNSLERLRALLLAAMVAVSVLFGASPVLAQDYGALRNTPGTACNNNARPVGPPTCTDWVNLSACLTHVASQPQNSGTCTQVSAAALQALGGARTACTTMEAEQARRITELTQRLARCEGQRVAARHSNLVRIPICLSGPEYGGAATVIQLRGNVECRVQMNARRQVLDVLSGPVSACSRIDRREVVRAGCYCPPGSQPVYLADRRGVTCAATVGSGSAQVVLAPSGASDPTLAARVGALEAQFAALTARVDAACRHTVVGADGAQAPSVDCEELNRLLMDRLFAAATSATPLNTSGIEDRLTRLETTVSEHTTQIAAIREDVSALRDSARTLDRLDAHFFVGGEGGIGVLSGMNPAYGVAGARLRVRISHLFSVHVSGGVLYGLYGAPMFPTATGYLADVGVGFSFGEGNVRHTIDLAFGVRTYTNTGYSEIQSIDRGVILGDYRGRVFGARASYEFAWKYIAVQPSVFVGYGDSALGVITTRGNQRVALFGSDVGMTVMGGLTFYVGTPPRL